MLCCASVLLSMCMIQGILDFRCSMMLLECCIMLHHVAGLEAKGKGSGWGTVCQRQTCICRLQEFGSMSALAPINLNCFCVMEAYLH